MQQLFELRRKHKVEIIWVTSGAIAWAADKTNFKNKKRTLPQKQALSAIGQPLIMDQYNLALQATSLLGAQVLLTASDMKDKARRKNLQNTLNELLKRKVVPILNENDAVATEEIQFGDNDSLASQVAIMMKAQKLILLTDVDGLYDSDPKSNKKAALIPYLSKISMSELSLAHPLSVSSQGTGGMYSKLLAAQNALKAGITSHFLRGDIPNNLLQIAQGQSVGTQVGGEK